MSSRLSYWTGAALAALLCFCGCSTTFSRSSTVPALLETAPLAGAKGPFLYVGGRRLSQYPLNSSEPLRSIKAGWGALTLALDSFGTLFAANGNASYGAVVAYEARDLKVERTVYTIYPLAL